MDYPPPYLAPSVVSSSGSAGLCYTGTMRTKELLHTSEAEGTTP